MNTISRYLASALAAALMLAVPLAHAQHAPPDDALFQGLGGKEGIRKMVDDFLTIVLADHRIKDAFEDTDMERLSAMLAEQFCELGGGPCKYSGKDMKTIHEDLKITNAAFNALAEDLQLAMDRHGIASSVQNRLIARLAPMQRDVVTR